MNNYILIEVFRMSRKPVLRLCTAVLVCIMTGLLAGAVGNAYAISVVPATMKPGEPVVISVADLPDGSNVSIRLTGSFSVVPGGDYLFGASEFVMPFSLNNGAVSAKSANTQYNVLSVQKGDTEVRVTGNSVNQIGGLAYQFLAFQKLAGLTPSYRSYISVIGCLSPKLMVSSPLSGERRCPSRD